MIAGLDSMTPPTAAQVDAAKAGGVQIWSGYLQTHASVGLARAWSKVEFDAARRVGATPIAYASGWDDPVACKTLAAQWNVRLCLDVETSIRADGGWVPAWLGLSGAGLYGSYTVFRGRTAAFYVLGGYPGTDPKRTWPADQPHPSGPCGWQWAGTQSAFGASVDRTWFDDSFGVTVPQIIPKGETLLIQSLTGSIDFYSGGRLVHLTDVAQVAALQAAGYTLITDPNLWNVCAQDAAAFTALIGGRAAAPPHSHDVPGTATSVA